MKTTGHFARNQHHKASLGLIRIDHKDAHASLGKSLQSRQGTNYIDVFPQPGTDNANYVVVIEHSCYPVVLM